MTDATPRRRAGPVYDDAMKILADDDLAAVLALVGVHERAERLNVELPATTMKADLLARTPNGIVHIEFVKDPTPTWTWTWTCACSTTGCGCAAGRRTCRSSSSFSRCGTCVLRAGSRTIG